MRSDEVEVRREELTSEIAASMIAALNAELSARYPEEGATHFRLDPEEVAAGRGAFFVACFRGKPVGCGAIRRLDARTAEIKRMYVEPGARGRGIGRALLAELESEASRLKVDRILLETGARQAEALTLYESSGFRRVDAYGEYVHSPLSICMEKRL